MRHVIHIVAMVWVLISLSGAVRLGSTQAAFADESPAVSRAEPLSFDTFGNMNLRPQQVEEHPQQDSWIGGLSLIASENTWPLLFTMPFYDANSVASGNSRLDPRCVWWDVQWGYVSPIPLTLRRLPPIDRGDMRLAVVRHALTPESHKAGLHKRVVEKDWVHVRYRYQYDDKERFETVYSRIAPGALFSATGDTLNLFANNWVNFQVSGRPDKEVGVANWPRLTRALLEYIAEHPNEYARPETVHDILPYAKYGGSTIDYAGMCLRPTALAFAGKEGVQVHGGNVFVSAKDMQEPWILVWFGGGSPLFTHTLPGFFREGGHGLRQMDCPFLLLLENRPRNITLSKDGLRLRYDGSAGRVVMLPLRGMNFFEAGETEAWRTAGKVPGEIVNLCRFWSARLMDYPLSVKQSARVNDDGTVTFDNRFTYESLEGDWRISRKKIAPVAPMVGTAYTFRYPVKFSSDPVNYHYFTKYGNYMAVEGTDHYSYTLGDVGKYVWQTRRVGELTTPEEKALAVRLDAEVRKTIDAGHLAPFVTFSFPYLLRSWHWPASSELVYSLADVADYVKPDTREALKTYLAGELAAHPPGTFNVEGKPRALGHLSDEDFKRVASGTMIHMPEMYKKRPEVLYHLWVYADKLGDWEYVERNWKLIDRIFRLHFENMDWPTSFFAMYKCRSPSISYRRGIHDVNAFISGAVAYARMADHLGKTQDSRLGYALASQWLMMRFACARFDESMHAEGMIRRWDGDGLSDAWWKANVMDTIGLRQIFAIDQYGVMLDKRTPVVTARFWGGRNCRYRYVFPEVGRFLCDYNEELEQRPFRAVMAGDPAWYLSGGMFEPDPGDCFDSFLAAARIMRLPSAELIRYVGGPDCAGDLYFFQKAAAALEQSSQARWQGVK